MSQASLEFRGLDAEIYLAKRLLQHGVDIFAGATDAQSRKELIRAAIIEHELDSTLVGRNPKTRKVETYAQVFERLYGEPLMKNQKRKQA